jgi:hypothetical protein
MTYREQLNKVTELGINICDLTIANELDCILDGKYTENEKTFEKLCDFARNVYLKSSDITAEAIARAIDDLLSQGKTVGQVVAMNKYTFINKAVCYM